MTSAFRFLLFVTVALVAVTSLSACASLRDQMFAAQGAYDEARYDEADVWLVDLERDTADMDPAMRARYYYYRGMTSYRLSRRNDALHYLALARETASDEASGYLDAEQRRTMDRSLEELTPQDASFRARDASPSDGSSGGEAPAEGADEEPSASDGAGATDPI